MAKSPYTEIGWPIGGVSLHSGYTHQDPGTCIDALNVRGYDPTTNALRGAQRAGHSKYLDGQIGSSYVQCVDHIVTASAIAGASVRTIKAVAVSGGNVRTFTRGGTVNVPTNGTGALHATNPYIGSTVLLNKLYFADGSTFKYYDPATDTVSALVASAGSLPTDAGNYPRIVVTWRGRLVFSGISSDPQNWFMSRQFDATDWDYAVATTTADAQMPVAGNSVEAGRMPDIVNCLIPYSDDLMLSLGDHSIWQFTNDPASGGQIDRVSDTVGGAFGMPWCKDAYGTVYFFGSRGGIYRIQPSAGGGAAPERISSKKVDSALLDVDMSTNVIKMVWDDRFQTVMIYITPIAGGTTKHYAYDIRNDAFWPDQFTNELHNPVAVHLMDGDSPDDRVVLLGCRDGYIRFIDISNKLDDDSPVSSYVYFGPIQSATERFRLKELRAVLGENSDQVALEVFRSHSPESAFRQMNPLWGTTIGPGRSRAIRLMATGQAMYVRLRNKSPNTAWQYEALFAWLEGLEKAAGRALHK